MATAINPFVPSSAGGCEPPSGDSPILRETSRRYAAAERRWCVATAAVLIVGAVSAAALLAWLPAHGIAAEVGVRGSPVLLFALAFRWCRSNHAYARRMRDVHRALQVCAEQARTANAKANMIRDVQKLILRIAAADEKGGIEVLEGWLPKRSQGGKTRLNVGDW